MDELIQNLLRLQSLELGETAEEQPGPLIAELRGKIPPQILGHYDRLRVRGKKGLTAVRNQVCTGCHMRVPLGAIMTLKRGEDIQPCDNCGRYLYLPAEEKVLPTVESPVPKPTRSTGRRKKVSAATGHLPEAGLLASTQDPPRINPG